MYTFEKMTTTEKLLHNHNLLLDHVAFCDLVLPLVGSSIIFLVCPALLYNSAHCASHYCSLTLTVILHRWLFSKLYFSRS